MNNILVSYNENNKIAQSLMYVLSQTKGVEIDDDITLTEEEMERVKKAEQSGIRSDIENLQAYLKSQYAS